MAPRPSRFEDDPSQNGRFESRRLEGHRYVGDKATMVVYDLEDPLLDPAVVNELLASERLLAFGPDTLAEARNRSYRLFKPQRRRTQA